MRKLLALPLLAALAFTGCSSDDGMARLNVRQNATDNQFVATFERALFTQNDGQTDVILLSGTGQTAGGEGAIANNNSARQVVHVKVLWQPTRTIRVDSPSAGNAMIDWQVIAGDSDHVAYAGSCWAKVTVDDDEATIDIRQANVSVKQVTGHMIDPLKHATVDGVFVAKRADATVRSYISDLHGTQVTSLSMAGAAAK
ncbi:MAG: hypothetical protein QM754_10490 [Tepidisphaeraceae bacterium]